MADQPLSGLAQATTINDPDLMLITQSGTSKKIAFEDFPMPTNYIGGLITSMGTDADHDVDIAPGSCRDDGDAANLRLASVLTKQLDAAWSVGDDQGGLDTGSIAATTLYAVWLIKRSDTGVVDALFSTSFTSPTMPTNYDLKRLIGSVYTDGSSDIYAFIQSGDEFIYIGESGIQPPNQTETITADETWQDATIAYVPPLCKLRASWFLSNPTSTGADDGKLAVRTKTTSGWVGNPPYFIRVNIEGQQFDYIAAAGDVVVDSSKKIEVFAAESTGAATVSIYAHGFTMLTRREP